MDDCLIFSQGVESHIIKLRKVFEAFRKSNFKLNGAKSKFLAKSVVFLGNKVEKQGISPVFSPTSAVYKVAKPKSVKEIISFVSFCSFYRRYIENFRDIAEALYEVMRSQCYVWGEKQQHAFDMLKNRLTNAPILRHLDPMRLKILFTDSSLTAIGAQLTQEYENKLFPIAYSSKTLSQTQRRYSIFELELY